MRKKSSLKNVVIVLICILVLVFLIYFAISLIANPDNLGQTQSYNDIAEVIDGDTFKTNDGEIVRLLCVDTPEKNQEGYDEATIFLREKLFDSDIRLEGNKTDQYGRSLRWVYADDVLINKEIVDWGFGTLLEYNNEDCGLMNE